MPLPGEAAPQGGEPDLTQYHDLADRHAEVVSAEDAEAAAQAELAEWKAGWEDALANTHEWGPIVAGAYAKARAKAGNQTVSPYDDSGNRVRLEGAERRAYELQPDVLIVDIVRRGRSLRSPIRDAVDERVALAGWTISQRTYQNPYEQTAEEIPEDKAPESPAVAAKRTSRADLLDSLDAVEEDADDVSETEQEPEKDENSLTELVVLMQDGKVVRFEGKGATPTQPGAPLRFGRARPDRELLDEEDGDKDEFKRQKELLEAYAEDNAEHFVQPSELELVAILDPTTIENADLGEPGTDSYLESDVVFDGLTDFLVRHRLAAPPTQQAE